MSVEGVLRSFQLRLDAPIQKHLKSVYACLSMAVLSGAAGAYAHLATGLLYYTGGLICSLMGVGLALALYFTPDNGKNRATRLGMLLGFAFLAGLGMGPLLDYAIRVDPSIVVNAFLMSSAIFASFSGVALYAPEGRYLFLGGTLLSGLSTLFWMAFMNLFFRSQLIFQVYMWAGLLIFCGFIVWDTQLIVEKRRRGDTDFIAHSLDLFIDFTQIFRKVLILLVDKEGRRQDERDSRKQRR